MPWDPVREKAKKDEIARSKVRPVVAGVSLDRQEMLKLSHKCRNTGRHIDVVMKGRECRVSPLRFRIYVVLCWPKPEEWVN